jgi:polyisoprenoid-binding protein YceI
MTATSATTTTWTLDAGHSNVEFGAKHMVFTTVRGRFADVEATIVADGDSPENATVRVDIKAASLDTRLELRDVRLRGPDFLDVDAFPLITFVGTKALGSKERFTLTGDLTMRGVTRPITLDVTYEGSGADPWGGERIGFSASGMLDRRDFGLVWNQTLEAGSLLVGNEIKIHIDTQLVKVI